MAQFSERYRNNMLDQFESTNGANPKLQIWTGSAPANCAAAATGTLLAEVPMGADPFAAAAAGVKSKSGTWEDTSANNSGTAGYGRIVDNPGTTCDMQFSVGTAGAEMILDSTTFVAGQPFQVLTFAMTAGGA